MGDGNGSQAEGTKDTTKVLEEEFKELGVSLDEMGDLLNPNPEDAAGDSVGSARGPMMEGKGSSGDGDATTDEGDGDDKGESTDQGDGDGASPDQKDPEITVSEDDLDEAMKMIKKKVGAAARKIAKKAKKRYKRMKAKVKRVAKKWRKSAAGKRWLKKYKRAKKKMGAKRLQQMSGRKRLRVSGMDLSGRLREELAESQGDKPKDGMGDLDILETGAVISAMIGDHFEDLELPEDAEAARATSDNVVALVDKHESEGKPVPEEDMTRALKALGVVIDHYEKLGEEGSDLPLPH